MEHNYPKLRLQAISGIKWNMVSQVIVYAVTLVGTAILSRLITPSEFGLFGMITVLTNVGNMVVAMGISMAIIQDKSLNSKDLSSIFWVNILLGLLIAAVFFIGAPLVADFYNQQKLIEITRWFTIIFLLHGANAVPLGILSKRREFKEIAYGQIAGVFLSYPIAIVMAVKEFGVYSLVYQALIMNLVILGINFYFVKWKPAVILKKAGLFKIKNFSLNYLPSQLIDFFATNLDILLIGRYLGARQVGLYGKAMALVLLPVNLISLVFNKSFYPIFSTVQNDARAIQRIYLKSSKMMSLILIPVYLLIILQAEDVIHILFGFQWTEAAPLVEILGIFAIFYSFNSFNDTFILSQGKANWVLKINIVEKMILVGLFLTAIQFGLIYFAYAKLIVTLIAFVLKFIIAGQIHKVTLLEWLKTLTKIIIASSICLIIIYLSQSLLWDIHLILRVLIVSCISGISFLLTLYLLGEETLNEVQNLPGINRKS